MKPSLALALLALALLTGCKNLRIASGEDDAYIHSPAELNATPPPPEKPLFPTAVGNTWTYQLGTSDIQEKATIVAPRLINGVNATIIKNTRVGNPTGGPAAKAADAEREEIYQISNTQILHISSSGGTEMVSLQPPMPLVSLPLAFSTPLEWQGGVRLRGSLVPSSGRSYLRSLETVTVPAGTFTAYRVDSLLNTQLAEGTSTFLTIRWFAPGVGVIKTRYLVHTPGQPDRAFLRQLVRYSVK